MQSHELIDLFHTLKRLVLDRDRRLASNASEQVRNVLALLLQLNKVSSSEGSGSGAPSYHRSQRTLQAVINSPDLAALPALRSLAQYTLLHFENLEKRRSNAAPTPLSSELEDIRTANAEITSILPPTDTALETLIYNYVSDSLQASPARSSQEPLNRLLGYEFTDRHGNRLSITSTSPHMQRAREIMGPAISETMLVCGGFWCSLLSVENFFALVSAHQVHGGVESPGFKRLLSEIEGGIEEGLKAGIKRAYQGFPYRYGVEAPGLEKLREGEERAYEEQLFCLEALGRLRYMQVLSDQREGGDERRGHGK
jgi:hypothetical protein